MNPLVVGVAEAATMLSISRWAVRQLVIGGELPTIELPSSKYAGQKSRRILIAVADVEAFIAAHRSAAAS